MRGINRSLLIVELLLAFLPCTLALLLGALSLPQQIESIFADSLRWQGAVTIFTFVACGIIGLATLVFVVARLLAGSPQIDRPIPVLAGVLTGIAPLLPAALSILSSDDGIDWLLTCITFPPLLATAHVLYLSRRLFITGFKHGKRPMIGAGTWTAVALVAGFAMFLHWLQQGISYDALKDRRAHWMQNKPAAYSYDYHPAGWLPLEFTYPKRIRVHGSAVTGASYTFGRGAGGSQYAPPTSTAWTMDRIFDELLEAKSKGARVRVRFDRTTGAVLHAEVVSDKEDADWAIEAKHFQWLDPNAAQEPMPMFMSYGRSSGESMSSSATTP